MKMSDFKDVDEAEFDPEADQDSVTTSVSMKFKTFFYSNRIPMSWPKIPCYLSSCQFVKILYFRFMCLIKKSTGITFGL